jgi:dienelactone hydrolase
MKTRYLYLLVVSSIFGAVQAQDSAPPPTPRSILEPPPDAPPIRENPPGPYAVTVESAANLPTHTIYRPADLTPFTGRQKLPIISWGNGACSNAGTLFKVFLTQIASHGYLAISIGSKDTPLPAFARRASAGNGETGPAAAPESPPAAPAAPLVMMSQDQQLIDAIDWAVSENQRKDSPYYGHLDPSKIAVMGQSCGGLQAIAVSTDPRIKTTVVWNSGVFSAATAPHMAMPGATKDSLRKFHAPVAYFMGGPADVAYVNAEDDFKQIVNVPVFKANLHVGHGGTYNHPGGGWFGEVGVAWLDWRLKGDRQAARYFAGSDCTLCTNPIWSVEKKNMR